MVQFFDGLEMIESAEISTKRFIYGPFCAHLAYTQGNGNKTFKTSSNISITMNTFFKVLGCIALFFLGMFIQHLHQADQAKQSMGSANYSASEGAGAGTWAVIPFNIAKPQPGNDAFCESPTIKNDGKWIAYNFGPEVKKFDTYEELDKFLGETHGCEFRPLSWSEGWGRRFTGWLKPAKPRFR